MFLQRWSKEVTHSKYWLALGEKYAEQLKGRNMRVPMKPGVDKQLAEMKPTEEGHYVVPDYPHRELVGSISFPSWLAIFGRDCYDRSIGAGRDWPAT